MFAELIRPLGSTPESWVMYDFKNFNGICFYVFAVGSIADPCKNIFHPYAYVDTNTKQTLVDIY